jgi:hypothetical protein
VVYFESRPKPFVHRDLNVGFLNVNASSECDNPTDKGMVRSDRSKPALIFFPLQEYTQQNPLSKF